MGNYMSKSQVVSVILITALVSYLIGWEMSVARVATECAKLGSFFNKDVVYMCKRKE